MRDARQTPGQPDKPQTRERHEKQAQQDKAWDLWLDCKTLAEIAESVLDDADKTSTVDGWVSEIRKSADFGKAPESRQHFDVWQFATTNRESGGQQPRRLARVGGTLRDL